jgi:cytochrome c-type biogenesis protein CcmH/NrfG
MVLIGLKRLLGSLLVLAVVLSGPVVRADESVTPPAMAPLKMDLNAETLNITNDLATAEAQAAAYPDNPEAQFLLAIAYSRSPYLEKALKTLQRTKKLVKHSPEGYATLDRLMGEYEAMRTYRAEDPLIHYRLAFGYYLKAYGLQKHYIPTEKEPDGEQAIARYLDQAEASMRRVVALDPGDIWARNYLGFLLAERKPQENMAEAIRIWEGSVAVSADNPGAYLLLGQAYLKQGNLKEAVKMANQGLAAKAFLQESGLKKALPAAPASPATPEPAPSHAADTAQ